jgi:RES domain-containing protein
MVRIWRIATDTPNYTADDLSGEGAKRTGGRWNRKGTAMIYASSSIALACLETLVHFNAGGLPLNRYVVCIEIPDKIWALTARVDATVGGPRVGWDAIPEGRVSLDIGEEWITSQASAVLQIPSVIVPEESNFLINPRHSDSASLKATKIRRFQYDPRLGMS